VVSASSTDSPSTAGSGCHHGKTARKHTNVSNINNDNYEASTESTEKK